MVTSGFARNLPLPLPTMSWTVLTRGASLSLSPSKGMCPGPSHPLA